MDVWIQIGVGLVLLGLGGEGVVRGAVGVARRLGVSELLIGLTLVGFGTSTPELLTSISAALRGSDGVAVGNIIGSNVSNILLIAALAAVARPIGVPRAAVFRDGGRRRRRGFRGAWTPRGSSRRASGVRGGRWGGARGRYHVHAPRFNSTDVAGAGHRDCPALARLPDWPDGRHDPGLRRPARAAPARAPRGLARRPDG